LCLLPSHMGSPICYAASTMAEKDYLGRRPDTRRFTLNEAQGVLPPSGTHPRSAPIYEHGSLLLKLFAPRGHDPQQPHSRDEVYFVTAGAGWFVNGDRRDRFATGDVLFVPAGVPHRFEEFTEDLAVWVVFYGPEGGEQP
jgi:mannose-6-phosphate isomerase-like protein (cupin superfamily)